MPVASSSVPAALCPIVLAAVRAQITRRGPCLWGFPSDPGQETHQGEIIGKGRERIKVTGRASSWMWRGVSWWDFGVLLSGVSFTQGEVWQGRWQWIYRAVLEGVVLGEQQTGRETQDPLEIPAADLVEIGVIYRAGQIEVFSSAWCLCRSSRCFLTGWILEIGM